MSIPISGHLFLRDPLGLALSIHFSGPSDLVGSAPRKKLRHTDISGTIARSWYTVAMPLPSASRGELNRTSSPFMRIEPSDCWCTPERILMNVDLPAPLSPSTQVTSPALTYVLNVRRAMMLP